MNCPYCGSNEYEAQDIIRNKIKGRFTEICVCFKCEGVFEIEYQYINIHKVDGE